MGKYHHSDGYPSGLGLYLFWTHRDFFGGDTKAMVKFFVDDEPVGWSNVIDTNLAVGPAWDDFSGDRTQNGPQSYSKRGETPASVDGDWRRSSDGPDYDIEWVYILTPGGLMVVDGEHVFKALVRWDDPEGVDQIWACEG